VYLQFFGDKKVYVHITPISTDVFINNQVESWLRFTVRVLVLIFTPSISTRKTGGGVPSTNALSRFLVPRGCEPG
jgi:hypothetical protein